MTTITDSNEKIYSYPTPRVDPGSAVLTAAGGVLCGLLGVGIGIFRYNNADKYFKITATYFTLCLSDSITTLLFLCHFLSYLYFKF